MGEWMGSVRKHRNRQGLNVFLHKGPLLSDCERNTLWYLTPDRPSVLDQRVDGLRILD